MPTQFHAIRESVQAELNYLFEKTKKSYPSINRVSIVRLHQERGVLSTLACCEDAESSLSNYECSLESCASLKALLEENSARLINDLSVLKDNNKAHNRAIQGAGYKSSFTCPLIVNNEPLGFLFANSKEVDAFDEKAASQLKMVAMVMGLLIYQGKSKVDTLKSTLKSMTMVSKYRDPETAEHLQRMANYTLIIARKLKEKYNFSDTEIDSLYMYAPLHDIGKISLPDSILLKSDRLTPSEFEEIKKHTTNGLELAESIIDLYQLQKLPYIDNLRWIIKHHHEKLDGSGYPDGISGDSIPIAARIVAVADIFDALTSERPYKKAWPNEDAFNELCSLSGVELDADCVNALCESKKEVLNIQATFKDKIAC